MIYAQLKGGLGNMMFQVAALHSLAIDNNDKIIFTNVNEQLDYLNNEMNFNPSLDHAKEYLFLLKDYIGNGPLDFSNYFNIPFHFQKLKYIEGATYNGFYQSEKWFKHNREEILRIFQPSEDVKKYIQETYKDVLEKKNTVAVHVRRGDYVKNQNKHAIQSLLYYKIAMDHYSTDHHFVIFSDDIEFCKQHFDKNCTFISDKDYVEIFLMSMMENNIIANSSFSWWGAWLNQNPDKKIVAPKIWFGPGLNHHTGDIVPESWIKI